MRIGIRSSPAAGKICTTLLLGVVPIALVIPGSGVAFSQSTPGAQAPLFTAIDLNPSGFSFSMAEGISGGQQVGNGYGPAAGHPGQPHALLWRGNASSVVDLHPPGFTYSSADAICGDQQVGSGIPPGSYLDHALLWRGSAGSVVDLHPPSGFIESDAHGTSGGQQVGRGATGECCGLPDHALLWRGSAASVVDLHPHPTEFSDFGALGTSGGQQVGRGSVSVAGHRGPTHALLWRGSAESEVDLHPSGFTWSEAHGTNGEVQVGYGSPTGKVNHALLWRGSAASVVDLHPPGFTSSQATGTNGEEQVGSGILLAEHVHHALLWRGSAASVVDLHAFLPPGFLFSTAMAIDSNGDIVGFAYGSDPGGSHAFLWRRNVPKPRTSRQNIMRC